MVRPLRQTVASEIVHLQGAGKLHVVNGSLIYTPKGRSALRIDPAPLRTLVCYGDVHITNPTMQVLFAACVQVSWMSPGGYRYRGGWSPGITSSLPWRQFAALSDEGFRLRIARSIVGEKLRSQVEALRHFQRQGRSDTRQALHDLGRLKDKVRAESSLERLRGFEGMAAKAWFAFVRAYIPPPFEFPGRQMRPPNDPINSLLSLGYTWVNTRVSAGIQAVGLDLGHAAYHAPRSGRPSLACDLMEPLRVPLVDRWVLLLCRRKSVQPDHFHTTSKGVRLVRSRFPLVLQSFERHFHEQQGSKLLRSGVAWFRDQVRAQTKNAGPEAASGETKACRS